MSRQAASRAGSVGRWLLRRAAGAAPWGGVDVWPSRYGYTHYRITVYPPGTTATERVWLRLWRRWPAIAAGLGLLVVCGAGGVLGVAGAAVAAGLAAAAALLGLARATRRQRSGIRSRQGGMEHVADHPTPVGEMALIAECWDRLVAADRLLASGALTAAQHELVWAEVWEAMRREPRARGVLRGYHASVGRSTSTT